MASSQAIGSFKMELIFNILQSVIIFDCLHGLVIRIPGYKSRGTGFDSQCCQIFQEVVSLEWGPLSLVRIIEELPE
jgi:hypothetical protein